MGKQFSHMTLTKRLQLEAYLKAKISPKEIAKLLGVHKSTVYREIKRGKYTRLDGKDYIFYTAYSPDIAEKRYRENLSLKGTGLKIENDKALADYIEFKICEEKYSPAAVLGEIEAQGLEFETSITKTTLYRYIDDGVFLTLTNKHLPVKRNKTKKKYKRVKKAARPPKGNSIETRPPEIDTRESFGNWEMDCVEGKKGTKKTLLVFTERKTRSEIAILMKDKTMLSVVKSLNSIERKLGSVQFKKMFKTITIDNGSEFQDFKGIETSINGSCRTTVYYCHPYSAYERGSNENANKLIRRYFPKGYDFTHTTKAEVKRVERWINNYPREMFGWHTSKEYFDAIMNELCPDFDYF